MPRRFAYVLIWLALTAEVDGYIFEDKWRTPLTWVGTLIFKGMPGLHLVPWDLMVIATLALAQRGAKKNRVRVVVQSIQLSFVSLAVPWLWGMWHGGSAYQSIFQLHCFVMQLFVALMVIATCRTTAHIETLGKVIVFATLYRACVLFLFYLLVARNLPEELPTLTDHADSVLFVSGLFVLVIAALEFRTSASIWWAVIVAIVVCTAIVLNNRRIGWLDMGVAIIVTFALLPKNKVKRRLNRILLLSSPLLLVYLAAGWGHPVGVFKPVGSISTMFGANQDLSSIMRDIENYNLIKTLKTNPLLGIGWGNKYIEEVRAYDISGIFPQYRYLPHNSLLGVIAFSGVLGFTGIWQMVPIASFLHARVYRVARNPIARVAALSGLVACMTVTVQMWGDVGFSHLMVNVMMGVSIGVAGRLPVLVGDWPTTGASSKTRQDVENRKHVGDAENGESLSNPA